MPIVRLNFNRIPYLGAFALATDKIALLPDRLNVRERQVFDALGVQIFMTSLDKSPLLGVLAAGNSRGLIFSDILELRGEARLAELGTKVERIPGRFTAFGNLILANDNGAVVNPDLPDDVLKILGISLGVQIERGTIAGIKNVGATGVATNRGALVHSDASSEELELIERVLRVPVDVGTACGGVKYVGLCMVANSNGAIVGGTTMGPELGRIESALGFI